MTSDTRGIAEQLGRTFTPTHLEIAAKILLNQNEVPSQLIHKNTQQVWLSAFAALALSLHEVDAWARVKEDWLQMLQNIGEQATFENILATLIGEKQKMAAKKFYVFTSTLNITRRRSEVLAILRDAIEISEVERKTQAEYLAG